MRVAALTLLLGFLCLAVEGAVVSRGLKNPTAKLLGFTHIGKAPSVDVSFTIGLKQQNLDRLQEIFQGVSDPKHPSYGRFLSKDEVDELVGATPSAKQSVTNWLTSRGVSNFKVLSDAIVVKTDVQKVEDIFGVEMHHFVHKNGKPLIRAVGQVEVPDDIAKHIRIITGLTEMIPPTKYEYKRNQKFSSIQKSTSTQKSARECGESILYDEGASISVYPQYLRSYYNVPQGAKGVNTSNQQAIAAFSDYFSSGAYSYFRSLVIGDNLGYSSGILQPTGSESCLAQGCDENESDLDVQYMTSMGEGIKTTFWANSDWVFEWALAVNNDPSPPLVHSISYGWSDTLQCQIDQEECPSLNGQSDLYIQNTEIEFQKMAVRGLSVLVSSGDDGATSFGGAQGNNPLDLEMYCPMGGCNYTSTMCGSFVVSAPGEPDAGYCIFPTGLEGEGCVSMFPDENGYVNLTLAFEAFFEYANNNVSLSCDVQIDQDCFGNYHFYSACDCSSLPTLSVLQGSYIIQPYDSYDPTFGAMFAPDYPASSAYVTSVGATQFSTLSMPTCTDSSDLRISCNGGMGERPASIATGSIITTGGGFSSSIPMPSWQQAAVSKFLSNSEANGNLPPNGTFNSNNRAYPDISFNGHNFIIASSAGNNSAPFSLGPVDGTSCSAPALAGLISLINDRLLNLGLSPLGFLNPLLYQTAVERPSAFNDIVAGDNACSRAYCSLYGYSAGYGWDAASGLGSPNFQELLDHILDLKLRPTQTINKVSVQSATALQAAIQATSYSTAAVQNATQAATESASALKTAQQTAEQLEKNSDSLSVARAQSIAVAGVVIGIFGLLMAQYAAYTARSALKTASALKSETYREMH